MSGNIFYKLLIILSLSSSLFGVEFSGSMVTGGKYKSSTESEYLYDKMKKKNMQIQGVKTDKDKSDFYITLDPDINIEYGDMSFSYSLLSDFSINRAKFSKLNQFFEILLPPWILDKFSFTLTLMPNIYMDDSDLIVDHPGSERGSYLDLIYGNVYLYLTTLYDYSSFFSGYIDIKIGYVKGIHKKVKFMDGPVSGIEIGGFFYPGSVVDQIKLKGGSDIFIYIDEDFKLCDAERTLNIKNSYVQTFATVELFWEFHSFAFEFQAQYDYLYWIDRDELIEENWQKRRIDHRVSIQPSFNYFVTKSFEVNTYYNFKRNFSNLGENIKDYTDYNSTNHLAGINLIFSF